MIELPPSAELASRDRIDPDPNGDPTFGEKVSAAWTADTIRTDAYFYSTGVRNRIVRDLYDRLPEPERAHIETQLARGPRRNTHNERQAREQELFNAIGRSRDAAGERFAGLPMTADDLEAEVLRQRRAELDEAEAVLAMEPSLAANLIGSSARAMTDPVSLALLPLGGIAVGFGRAAVISRLGSGALFGAAGEAGMLPREFEVAKELGLPDPNIGERLAVGAVAGAGFEGLIVGAQRVAQYALGRQAPGRPRDVAPDEHEADVTTAEADLLTGRSPADQPVMQSALSAIDDVVDRIIGVESAGNPSARNPESSAGGLGQFIDSTWMDMIERHRPDLLEGRSEAEVLALKFDPQLSRDMTRIFTEENVAYLQSRGLPTEPGDIYLAHFLGKGGAAEALRAGSDVPIRSVLTANAISANRGIRYNGKPFGQWTVRDLRAWAASKMDTAPPVSTTGATGGAEFGGYTARGYTETGQIAAGDMVVDVRYEVVDAGDLQFATGDLQPRDRTRATSDEQIADMAARLDPARLMPAPEADRGAPIVGPDGMIESGNGRVRAIARAADVAPDRLGAYRRQIELAGYSIPEGVETPVLIARRTSDMSDEQRAVFAYRANSPDVARMSATEIARAHSRLIDGALLGQLDMARPLANQANRDFARGFLARLPQAERGAYTTARGGLSYDGERALEAALFARAFEADELLAQFAERGDPALKSFIAALQDAAPAWAALRAEIASGRVAPSLDISAYVNEALMLIGEARRIAAQTERLGIAQAIEDMLSQSDMFDALSPLTAALVRKFFQNGRTASAEQIAEFLKDYAGEAIKIGSGDLLGDLPGPLDVLRVLDADTFSGIEDIGRPKGRADAAPDPALAAPVSDLFADVADNPELERQNRAALEGARAMTDVAAERIIDLTGMDKAARITLERDLKDAQPFAQDGPALLEKAAALHEALNDALEEALAAEGQPFKRAPLKKLDRIEEKVRGKYAGNYRKLTDAARAGFSPATPEQADAVLRRLAEQFELYDEGWNVTPQGYFDRKLTVRAEDGTLGELQLWPPGMAEAKANGGHQAYGRWRSETSTPEEVAEADAYMRDLYAGVAAELPPSWLDAVGIEAPRSASASATASAGTSIARSSDSTSAATIGAQSEPVQSNAVSPETAASSEPSNSNNVMGDTSAADIAADGRPRNSAAVADARAELARLSEILDPDTVADVMADIRATLDEVEAEDALADVLDTCTLRFRGGSA